MSARSPLFCNRYRSEEHTSELQSQSNLVCRLLLEKKKQNVYGNSTRVNKSQTLLLCAVFTFIDKFVIGPVAAERCVSVTIVVHDDIGDVCGGSFYISG